MQTNSINHNNVNKLAWDQLYASTEDLVWGSAPVGFIENFLKVEIETGRNFKRVLDAATGEGRNLLYLSKIAENVSACDSSSAALSKIPEKVRHEITLVNCDLAKTPFPDASFDFILLCDTVETLPNAADVLKEMRRIIAPNGALVCNIPGPEGDVAGIEMTQVGEDTYLYKGSYYFKFFRDDEVASLVSSTGWSTERIETMTWIEAPHPGFRGEPHQHCSRVYLLMPATSRGDKFV
jgi:SAM-dependent methyltransferase